jgi:hypothetical protein
MNKEKICSALVDWPEEKQGKGSLYDSEYGCYCALGWLAHKAGIPDDKMDIQKVMKAEHSDNYEAGMEAREHYHAVYKEIYHEYDMTAEEGAAVWSANDTLWLPGHVGQFDTPKKAVQTLIGCTEV